MQRSILILSGHVSSGKSTLSSGLGNEFGFSVFKTGEYLIEKVRKAPLDRKSLQIAGEALDKSSKGKWVLEGLERYLLVKQEATRICVDSVRIKPQIDHIRKRFGVNVLHVHLRADLSKLKGRYSERGSHKIRELESFSKVLENRTEQKVDELSNCADLLIDTGRNTPNDVLARVAARLGLYGREVGRLVDVVVGGQYGSEGKGNIAAFIAKEYDFLVRVGGPNAGHKVYAEPKPITFHQLPSGSTRSAAKLIIGPGAVINPQTLKEEINEFGIEQDRLFIDPQATIIVDEHIKAEARLVKKIGSTGQGVGIAAANRIVLRSDPKKVLLAKDVKGLKPYIKSSLEIYERAFRDGKKILLEGTQGTALSLYHGHYPHVTSRDTTVAGCLAESGIAPTRVRKVIMVCRTYPIRVQSPKGNTSGWMSQEITLKDISERSGISLVELEATETTSTTKRKRRIAEFDWKLLRTAASLNGPTDIALTFVDYLDLRNKDARRFGQLTPDTIQFVEEVERVAAAKVSLISTRFSHRNIIDRRNWGENW